MAWFRKRKTYLVHYTAGGYIRIDRRFAVKAQDIAGALRKCAEREVYPISLIDWEILEESD